MPTINQLHRSKRSLALLFLFLLLCLNVGCFIYYKRTAVQTNVLTELPKNKTFRFYLTDEAGINTGKMWQLYNAQITQTAISGQLQKLNTDAAKNIATVTGEMDARKSRYDILMYYKTIPNLPDTGAYTLNYADVHKVEVYEINWGKSILISSLITLGSAVLLLGVIWVIILLTKESCPFIYTNSPDGVAFEGEIYSGAVFPNLERHDYLPLKHLQPVNNQYQLHITNEVKEEQHTNLLELYAIDHQPQYSVLIDKNGNPQTLRNLQSPVAAVSLQGNNILNQISCSDNDYYLPHPTPDANPQDGMVLTFVKPPKINNAKLFLNARNSFWLDNLYGQFLDEFGALYPRFETMSNTKTQEELQAWMLKQKLPLSVYVQTTDGNWQPAGYFNLIGPMAFKNDVLPVDLSSVQTDTFKVKLSCGFMFWDIDEVAIDYSANQPVTLTALPVQTATDQYDCNVSAYLQQDDTLYYHQPYIGDEASVTFTCPPLQQGLQRTLILHSKGYYHILRQPGNHLPNLAYLQSFRQPDALPRFSVERFNGYIQQPAAITLSLPETPEDCPNQNIQP
ncbi:hypothetical protein C7N43_12495 [Sphingobacteriales bacterium UPWRP_1]|nr:hypothetical protein B6N25_03880 [Sphingobacteriales bacterium TSM_CSS]PSJ76664.1 hypothetical protein C7N43_12495 [Sphingobacteriales bacterium UPWRP_1]